ncbi:MAG: LpxD N-terminal domain-containing protein [Ectothiorhodospira sp.]
MPVTLKTLAGHLGGTLHGGDPNAEVEGVAPLSGAGRGQVAFVTRGRFREALSETRAGLVILVADDLPACPVPALVCDDPHLASPGPRTSCIHRRSSLQGCIPRPTWTRTPT